MVREGTEVVRRVGKASVSDGSTTAGSSMLEWLELGNAARVGKGRREERTESLEDPDRGAVVVYATGGTESLLDDCGSRTLRVIGVGVFGGRVG